ncbi:Rap1a/Tai family immunity protein [Novosphingobium aquimarinum]|uniref:Rap1a/Tai family immunity protein n=1 Tax=Novosphingobium aquimarinum TaxID=2682494 RepID=UPI0012EBC9C6|nr:Rap1a/Tai family immunity protein [Novosphingobium aquimarinum]
MRLLPIWAICLFALVLAGPQAMAQPAPVAAGAVPEASTATPSTGNDLSFGYMTAAKLAEQCAAPSGFAMSYCFAYLAGVRDTTKAYEVWLGQSEFCAPATVTQVELRDVFNAFLAANPDYRSGQGASVTMAAFKAAYPCGSTSGRTAPADSETEKRR